MTPAKRITLVVLRPVKKLQDLKGQIFRYEKVELKGATALITAPSGDPLVTVNKVGKGSVVFVAVPDLLGVDERITPFAAHMLAHVFADASPVKVTGDVEYLINRTANGWVVTLLNNNGVFKTQQGMAQVDRSAYVNVTIACRTTDSERHRVDQRQLVESRAGSSPYRIAPGGVAIVELEIFT